MFYLVLSLLIFPFKDISNKVYGKNFKSSTEGLLLHNTIAMYAAVVALVAVNLISRGRLPLQSGTIMILTAVFGISYLLVNVFMAGAMACGPMGLTAIVCGVGGLLSGTLYGIFFCGDKVTVFNATGAVLMTIAIILITPHEKKGEHKAGAPTLHWFFLAFISFLINAELCIIKKAAVSKLGADSSAFMLWGFIFAAVFGTLIIAGYLIKGERFGQYLGRRVDSLKFIPVAAVMGLCASMANTMQMLSLAYLPAIVVYPVSTVVPSIIDGAISVLVFKDQKMTLKIYIAYIICFAGVIMINF